MTGAPAGVHPVTAPGMPPTGQRNQTLFLSITNARRPATDLGYLLHKHPGRLNVVDTSSGRVSMCFPRADDDACTFALSVEADPVALVREREGTTDAHVNDRPYAASSLLAHAVARVLGTARAGRCPARPDLVGVPMPLSVVVEGVGAGRRGLDPHSAFAPLGYRVAWEPYAVDARGLGTLGDRSGRLSLSGDVVLADLLDHLCVLLPALDGDIHSYVDEADADRLAERSAPWLAGHPRRDEVVLALTKRVPGLGERALAGILTASGVPVPTSGPGAPLRLDDLRRAFVIDAVAATRARSLLDAGCGEGKLLARLADMPSVRRVLAVDPDASGVARLAARLSRGEVRVPHGVDVAARFGTLAVRDAGLSGFDAAVVSEVVEHVDPFRLPAFARHLFADAAPVTVVLTTPNREYNAAWGMPEGMLRHRDHRFEWDRAGFEAWVDGVRRDHGYAATLHGIGDEVPGLGHPTQAAIFRRG